MKMKKHVTLVFDTEADAEKVFKKLSERNAVEISEGTQLVVIDKLRVDSDKQVIYYKKGQKQTVILKL